MADDELDDIYHDRANHEDNLHVNRSAVFINLNGFFGVAVGVIKSPVIGLVFSVMILVIDVSWTLWAMEALDFIHRLREHGKGRADEKLLRSEETLYSKRQFAGPLVIMSRRIPFVLTLGWLAIFIYFIVVLEHFQ